MVNELYHHGVKGQKWGVRRYQNEDGTRTELGKKKYKYGRVVVNGEKSLQNTDFVSVSKSGYGTYAVEKTLLDKYEKKGQEYIEDQLRLNAQMRGESYESLIKYVDTHPKYAKQVNRALDKFMEEELTKMLLDAKYSSYF